MEASSSTPKRAGRRSLKGIASSRGGSLMLAVAAATIAGLLLLAFVNGYRDDVNKEGAPTTVFVARSLIPRGTSADIIASQGLLQRTTVKGSDVLSGAIADPVAIKGQTTMLDISPGQQITATDFTPSADGVLVKLSGRDRAVAIPVDATHGNLGQLRAGDRVDVLVSLGGGGGGGAAQASLRTLLQNVDVLSAPSAVGGSGPGAEGGGNVVLRVTDEDALDVAFAADNAKLWLILRPPVAAKQSPKSSVTFDSLGRSSG